jgi:glycerol kinase
MAKRFVLAIDQGTTGSTVLVVDVTDPKDSVVVGRHTVDFKQHYPQTGWVEHDLEQIWSSVGEATTKALDQARAHAPGIDAQQIVAIGITNQRETLCVFDRKTAKPLARAIVWQCKRSTPITARLKEQGLEAMFRARTGLVLDPYFSGTKITWLMENAPDVAAKLRSGAAVLGTIDTYLIARLTGGASFVTEASNASRTLAFNIHTGEWDKDLMEPLRIPGSDCLPRVVDSAGDMGRTKGVGFLPDGIPITGALGDQQAALAGQTCFDAGEAKCTYGTGAFLLATLGPKPLASRSGMLTTVAWQVKGARTYAFEGSAFIAGAAVQFLRDQLGMLSHASETAKLAQGQVGAPEVYFVPALAGLGAPYWDPKAQGAFFGLTRGTTKGQIVRAVLEGIAFEVADITRAMSRDLGAPLSVLRVDGGAAANDLLMEAQASFADVKVDRPANLETTAFGAALFAGLGVGLYGSLADLRRARRTERLFEPRPGEKARSETAAQLAGWDRAVRAVKVFAGSDPQHQQRS